MDSDRTPVLRDVPIGIDAVGERHETDSMGGIDVPADRYWGAQTQRSLVHFAIGDDRMPKRSTTPTATSRRPRRSSTRRPGGSRPGRPRRSSRAADEAIAGKLDENFPLYVWQTGSGTQSNMNVNEVLSNRAIQLLGGTIGSKTPIHPNDDVNMAQSSNDTFPTAMHIAAVMELERHLLPNVARLDGRHRREGAKLEGRREDRAHPPRGRGTADRRPRVVGLGAAAQRRDSPTSATRHDRPLSSWPPVGRPWARVSTRRRASAGEIAAKIAELTGLPFRDRAQQVRRAGIAGRHGRGHGGAARSSRWR